MRPEVSKNKLNRYFLCILSTEPPVIYLQDWLLKTFFSPLRVIFELLRRRRAYVLVSPSWSHESEHLASQAAKHIRRHRRWFGGHRFTYLCNTPEEVEYFNRFDVDAIFCNQNAFLDERIYFPDPAIEKSYDAIYDASFIEYKRHHLAGRIESLALNGYIKEDSESTYVSGVQGILTHAHWFKRPNQDTSTWLSDSSINAFLNASRVGLCLSALEGAMYASAQYLLAGLPVVTTHNKGGRDTFFHPDYVRWVDDDPDAVNSAVRELASDPPDPQAVRSRTLTMMAEHRMRLVSFINDIYRQEGCPDTWAESWPVGLPNKLFDQSHTTTEFIWALLNRNKLWP